MAKKENAVKAEAAKPAKKEAAANPGDDTGFSREQLIAQGPKGILKVLGLTAVKAAARNNFEGVEGFGNKGKEIKAVKDADGKETEASAKARKTAANKIQPKWTGAKGSLYRMARNPESAEYKKLFSLAKAASGDLEKQVYSEKVKAFLQYMTEGHGGGGVRSYDTSNLGGLL